MMMESRPVVQLTVSWNRTTSVQQNLDQGAEELAVFWVFKKEWDEQPPKVSTFKFSKGTSADSLCWDLTIHIS